MKTKYIIIAIIGITFFSCEKSLEYTEKQFEPRVVANSILFPDSLFSVSLHMSKSILDENREVVVPNADVKLFENGIEVFSVYNYSDDDAVEFKPAIGASYQIEIASKDQKLFSSTNIPVPVSFMVVDTAYVQTNSYYWYYKKALKVSLNIDDPANEVNYYRLIVRQKYYTRALGANEEDTVYSVHDIVVRPRFNDPLLMLESSEENPFNIDEVKNTNAVFEDQLFNGTKKTIDLYVNNVSAMGMGYSGYYGNYSPYGSPENPYKGKDTIMNNVELDIFLWSLSEEAYLYYKSRNAYDSTYGDEFVEPVPVYTNVENGLGIFMGYSVEKKTVKIDPWNFY